MSSLVEAVDDLGDLSGVEFWATLYDYQAVNRRPTQVIYTFAGKEERGGDLDSPWSPY